MPRLNPVFYPISIVIHVETGWDALALAAGLRECQIEVLFSYFYNSYITIPQADWLVTAISLSSSAMQAATDTSRAETDASTRVWLWVCRSVRVAWVWACCFARMNCAWPIKKFRGGGALRIGGRGRGARRATGRRVTHRAVFRKWIPRVPGWWGGWMLLEV